MKYIYHLIKCYPYCASATHIVHSQSSCWASYRKPSKIPLVFWMFSNNLSLMKDNSEITLLNYLPVWESYYQRLFGNNSLFKHRRLTSLNKRKKPPTTVRHTFNTTKSDEYNLGREPFEMGIIQFETSTQFTINQSINII